MADLGAIQPEFLVMNIIANNVLLKIQFGLDI